MDQKKTVQLAVKIKDEYSVQDRITCKPNGILKMDYWLVTSNSLSLSPFPTILRGRAYLRCLAGSPSMRRWERTRRFEGTTNIIPSFSIHVPEESLLSSSSLSRPTCPTKIILGHRPLPCALRQDTYLKKPRVSIVFCAVLFSFRSSRFTLSLLERETKRSHGTPSLYHLAYGRPGQVVTMALLRK